MPQTTVTVDDIIRRHVASHTQSYYAWIRHIVTLATGALTALISLQGQYLPNSPQAKWSLVAGLLALILTILFGVLALREESALPLRRAQEILDLKREKGGSYAAEKISSSVAVSPSCSHAWYARLLVL